MPYFAPAASKQNACAENDASDISITVTAGTVRIPCNIRTVFLRNKYQLFTVNISLLVPVRPLSFVHCAPACSVVTFPSA